METAAAEKLRRTLGSHLPAAATDSIFDFLVRHNTRLRITRQRQTKLGDYRWPQPQHPFHEISVNGDLNPYLFLWVLLHEMAHLNTHLRHGNGVLPHGHEWQEEYRQLLLEYLETFPADLTQHILQYCRHIPLNRTIKKQIEGLLHHHDEGYSPDCHLILDQLPAGTIFRLTAKPQLLFRSIKKRRTRWHCVDLHDRKEYLVAGTAEVQVVEKG